MEKKIILTMHTSKKIDIVLDNDHHISIEKDNRSVKADDIYNLLSYKIGDTFIVESVNEQNLDEPVLKFFIELIRDITDRLNKLSEKKININEMGGK